jgi:hypothetical protein
VEGNGDTVVISDSSMDVYTTLSGGDESSPFNAAPYETATGTYSITATCNQSVSQVFGNTILNTNLVDQYMDQVYK